MAPAPAGATPAAEAGAPRQASPSAASGAPLAAPLRPASGAPGGGPTPASLACAERQLARTAIMAERAPVARGWRLRLRVWSSPPAGWLDKGSILHDGDRIMYVPNGATRDLAEAEVRDAVRPILHACR